MSSPNFLDLPCLRDAKMKPKQHQLQVVNHMLKNRGLIAIHSVGTGKTLTAVAAIQCVLKQDPSYNVVIVTPTSLQDNMKKEMVAFGSNPNDKRITFKTMSKFAIDFKDKSDQCKKTFLIIDEAHNLKTFISGEKGARSKVVVDCAKKSGKVLLLTATPVLNRPNEIINLVAMVDGEDPINYKSFESILENEDEFKDFFKCKISYHESDSCGGDFPCVKEHNQIFKMTPKYYKLYRKVEKYEVDKGKTNVFGNNANLQVFLNGVRRAANSLESEKGPKINWIIDKIITENEKNKLNKTLIFSSFLDSGSNLVVKRLKKEKIKYEQINGSMSINKRKEAVRKYNSGEISVLIISKAGGEGLDLKGTRHVIIMEPAWSEALLDQVKGRAVRYKSHEHLSINQRKVDIWNLYLVKPTNKDGYLHKDDDIISVDDYLKQQAKDKKNDINDFMKRLKNISIEKQNCNRKNGSIKKSSSSKRSSAKRSSKRSSAKRSSKRSSPKKSSSKRSSPKKSSSKRSSPKKSSSKRSSAKRSSKRSSAKRSSKRSSPKKSSSKRSSAKRSSSKRSSAKRSSKRSSPKKSSSKRSSPKRSSSKRSSAKSSSQNEIHTVNGQIILLANQGNKLNYARLQEKTKQAIKDVIENQIYFIAKIDKKDKPTYDIDSKGKITITFSEKKLIKGVNDKYKKGYYNSRNDIEYRKEHGKEYFLNNEIKKSIKSYAASLINIDEDGNHPINNKFLVDIIDTKLDGKKLAR